MATASAYRQLAEQLLSDIAAGRYPVGGRLPTEAELCDGTGLSRGTVRRALGRVEELGMISRRPGDGSRVVALAPVDDYQPVVGSADDIVALVERTKIIRPRVGEIVADRALARRLGARAGSAWHLIEGPRVRRGRRDPPLCWSEQYLRADIEGFDVLRRGAFTAAEAGANRIEQTVSAAVLDERVAAALESDSTVALVVTRRQRDDRGRLVSVGIHTHPADRYELRTVVLRPG